MDNAATTYPKPPNVVRVMSEFMENIGSNAGRSGHRLSIASGRVLYETREKIANLFNASDPLRVIFTKNATEAINIVLHGYLKDGDTVATSTFEHNSTKRPLHFLEKSKNIRINLFKPDKNGDICLDDAKKMSQKAALVTCVHGNNVTGKVYDIKKIGAVARQSGAKFMVDAAQTAGLINIDMQKMNIDFLCFSAHKGLYGAQGLGVLILGADVDYKKMDSIIQGGTGSRSEEEFHINELPDKFEAGTANGVGVAGLSAGLDWLSEKGFENNYNHEKKMRDKLYFALKDIKNVTLYAAKPEEQTTNVLSFKIDNKSVSEVGRRLDEDYNILTRVGLHCAPCVHKTIGTFPEGTVRLSTGAFTSEDDVARTISAIKEIAECAI